MQQLTDGTMRRNKRTGEVQVLRNGQWVSQGGAAPSPQPGPMVVGTPRPEKPVVHQVGNQLGVVDPNTGAFTPTYTAPEKPNLPAGYRLRPDGNAERIPGLPPAKGEGGLAIPVGVKTGFEQKVSAFSDLQRAITGFQDDYSGPGSGFENTAQGALGIGTPGQRDWWADFKTIDNITRNALFGASLSEGEKKAYADTTVTPNMRPDEVRRNLNRRMNLARKILAREHDFLVANGYNPEAVKALMGGLDLSPPPKDNTLRGDGEAPPELSEMSDEQKRAYAAFWKANPNPTPQQLSTFLEGIGAVAPGEDLGNAGRIIDAVKEGRGYSTAIDREAILRDEIAKQDRAGVNQDSDAEQVIMQGATLGLSDEAAGVGRGLSYLFQGKNPADGYALGRDAERFRTATARTNLGGMGTALEIGGGLASGNINALAAIPTLGGRIVQGAKAGAAGGGIAGFGYGEGTNSLLSGVGGSVVGAGVGAALPVAGAVIGNRVGGMRRLLGKDPALPRRIISEAIDADGNTPRAVGQVMDAAHQRGSPMAIADTGENARGLLSSVSRQPGPSRTIAKTATIDRQNAQAERISAAVVRDLGPTANIREMGEELIERARTASRPHYEAFEAAPGASVVKLDDLALRPAFQKALDKTVRIAQEEGVDPTTLGIRFNEAGEVVVDHEALSWRSLDYIKKGLDDVVEGYRDSVTGKLNLNTHEARATNATLRTLIARMDKANPHYAKARAAYAGPAKMREAMERGVKALSKSPDDIMAQMKNMGDSEKEAYRLGVRKAIIDLVNSRRDGGDKVALLLGTPKSRAALARIFGSGKDVEKFIQTLRDEEAMGLTYKAVNTGSPTAERMATDATTNDTGLAETAVDAALRGAGDTLWSSVVNALQKLRDVDRFGAGKAGERTRESIAALLSETDPAVLRELVNAAQKARARQRITAGKRTRRAVTQGRNVGVVSGMALGRTTEQR